jgi:hypothetical protein
MLFSEKIYIENHTEPVFHSVTKMQNSLLLKQAVYIITILF